MPFCLWYNLNIMNKPDYKKIVQVLNYIAKKSGGEINYLKALKLLYFAERLHLREYGRLITNDSLVAMKLGTLGSQTRDIITMSEYLPHVVYKYVEDKLGRDLKKYIIKEKNNEFNQLSKTDISCVDKILSLLGKKTKSELVNLTHDLPEWRKHKYEIEEENLSVVKLDIVDLFKPSSNRILKEIFSQTDAKLNLSMDLFQESLEQQSQLA